MKIIMICGKARSGKDTLTDYLIPGLESGKVCRIQISQYIKYYAMKYFGWDGKEETKPRDLLNKIGTEIIREKIDPLFHINRLLEDLEVLSYFFDTFIINDVRLPLEIEKVKEKYENVTTIKIFRDSSELSDKQKKEITEVGFDDYNDFDYVVDNSGTLENLEKKANEIINEIGD